MIQLAREVRQSWFLASTHLMLVAPLSSDNQAYLQILPNVLGERDHLCLTTLPQRNNFKLLSGPGILLDQWVLSTLLPQKKTHSFAYKFKDSGDTLKPSQGSPNSNSHPRQALNNFSVLWPSHVVIKGTVPVSEMSRSEAQKYSLWSSGHKPAVHLAK